MMTLLGLLGLAAAIGLAAVFAAAGAAKLADLRGTRKAMHAFGAPSSLAGVLAVIVPASELTVAALLLPGSTRVVGAAGGLVLLGVFSAAIAVNLALGRTPDCNCFGNLHSRPTSRRTLARNGLLAGAGVAVLATSIAGHTPSAVDWMSRVRGVEVLALGLGFVVAALVVVGGSVLIELLRSHGAVLLRLEHLERALADNESGLEAVGNGSLPIGTQPTLALTSIDAEPVSLADPGRETLVLFWSPDCGFCNSMRKELLAWERHRPATAPRLLVVSSGDEEATRAEGFDSIVVLDPDFDIGTTFGAGGTPMAVLLDDAGRIASPLHGGAEGVFALAGRIESWRADETREEVAR